MTNDNDHNTMQVQNELTHTNARIMETKNEITNTVNAQWKEVVEFNTDTDKKIDTLRTQSELCMTLSNENMTTIEMVQSVVKDLQDLTDKSKNEIQDLFGCKVDTDL